MENKTLILSVIISLAIGFGTGYSLQKNSIDNGAKDQELQDSITMMKEQSGAIQKMSGMMKTSGVMMQEMGMKYKDEDLGNTGKDMEMMGEKYMQDQNLNSGTGASMNHMMGN